MRTRIAVSGLGLLLIAAGAAARAQDRDKAGVVPGAPHPPVADAPPHPQPVVRPPGVPPVPPIPPPPPAPRIRSWPQPGRQPGPDDRNWPGRGRGGWIDEGGASGGTRTGPDQADDEDWNELYQARSWGGGDERWVGEGDRRVREDRPRGEPRREWRSPRRYHRGAYRPPSDFYVRSWTFGDILPPSWYGGDYRIRNRLKYGLPTPPRGYDWVRVGSDALLVDPFTGRVVQVVRLVFR